MLPRLARNLVERLVQEAFGVEAPWFVVLGVGRSQPFSDTEDRGANRMMSAIQTFLP
jgi:hypothetical protein